MKRKISVLIVLVFILSFAGMFNTVFADGTSFSSSSAIDSADSIEIKLEYEEVHAGCEVPIEVFIDGSNAMRMVNWSVYGKTSSITDVILVENVLPGGMDLSFLRLYIGLDENAEEITLRATSIDDPSVYAEVIVKVLPPLLISNVELQNDANARCIDDSMIAAEAEANFRDELIQVFPAPHEVMELRMVFLGRVSDEYTGQGISIIDLSRADQESYIEKDAEYYFILVFDRNTYINGNHYFDPDGIRVMYNGEKINDWEVYDGDSPMYAWFQGSLLVYIKAHVVSEGEIYVEPIGVSQDEYTVSGSTVTVSCKDPCKVGYYEEGQYIEVKAVSEGDGVYSFVVPSGIREVVLCRKGDINGDGKITTADVAKSKAVALGKTTVDEKYLFAADVNGDGKITTADVAKTKAVALGKTSFN